MFRVINEGCIKMFCNTQPPITLNKSYDPKCKFCNTKSWKKLIGLFLQTFVTSVVEIGKRGNWHSI